MATALGVGLTSNAMFLTSNPYVGVANSNPQFPLDVLGNANVSGTVASGTGTMFRNRVINGDFRLDTLRLGSNVQTGNIAASTSNIVQSVDRFQLASGTASSILAAKQIALSAADQLAIGNISSKAVALSPSVAPDPTLGLTTLVTFDGSNAVDTLGGLVGPTVLGTPQYVAGKIGTNMLYLANEANSAAATKASNTMTYSYTQTTPLTISCWFYANTFGPSCDSVVWSFGSSSLGALGLVSGNSTATTSQISANWSRVNNTTLINITSKTWYHAVVTYIPSTSVTFYMNGVNQGSFTTSVPSSITTNSLVLGDCAKTSDVGPFSGYVDDFRIYNRALSLQDVTALYNYNGSTIPMAITSTLNTGLMAYIPFEGGSVQDVLGALTAPTWTGTPAFTTGKVGSTALNLSANPAAGIVNTCIDYTLTSLPSPFSCSVWINPASVGNSTDLSILCFGNTSSWGYDIALCVNGVYVDACISGNQAANAQICYRNAASYVAANTWSLVTCTMSATPTAAGTNSLYINGVLVGSASISSGIIGYAGVTNKFRFGGWQPDSTRAYSGIIDDFRIYNRVLTAAEIGLLAANTPALPIPNSLAIPQAPSTTGLVSYYPFEGSLTDSQAANTLTPNGTMQYVGGIIGSQALYLANEGNVLATSTRAANYAQIASYNIAQTTSVSAWVYFTKMPLSSQWSVIWEFGGSSPGSSEYLQLMSYYISTTQASLYTYSNPGGNASTGTVVNINTWYHVAVVFVPSTSMSLYVNGVLISTTTSVSAGASGQTFRVGDSTTTNNRPFSGYVDDLRVYNRALSAANAANLYYAGQNNGYVLYQQPIQGQALVDLGWGTTNAQSATLSTWIKNNSATAQQYTLALNSANTAGLVTWIPFENGSAADIMGGMTGPVVTGTLALSSSTYKVGSSAMNFSANTGGATATTSLNFSTSAPSLPFTCSMWLYAQNITASYNMPFCFGANGVWGYDLGINNLGQLFTDLSIGVAGSSATSSYGTGAGSTTAIQINTWTHVALTISLTAQTHIMYVNGVQASINTTLPTSGTIVANTNAAINQLRIGSQAGNWAYQGYLDDFRIYNTVLTQAQIYQLYINNANSTTFTPYLIPRSLVYTTPSIPSAAWQKIAVTVPGDTLGTYANDATNALTVSLCLGAGTGVSISNVALASGNASSVWNNGVYYAGSNVQTFGTSSSSFLAGPYNSVYMTGLQLEKGTMVTPFEYRPLNIETTMSTLMPMFASVASSSLYNNSTSSFYFPLSMANYTNGAFTNATITGQTTNSQIVFNYAGTYFICATGQLWGGVSANVNMYMYYSVVPGSVGTLLLSNQVGEPSAYTITTVALNTILTVSAGSAISYYATGCSTGVSYQNIEVSILRVQ